VGSHSAVGCASPFLRGRTLDELIDEQQTPIIADISTLAADFWPEDESAEDINAYIYAQRHTDHEPAR
jgi:hypothetical protein